MKTIPRFAAVSFPLSAILAWTLGDAVLLAAPISEPDTLLYGRVVNRAGAVEEFVSEGVLTWSFQPPEGGEETLTTRLEPLQGGLYSYQLRIPHSLAMAGLQPAPKSLPLGIDARRYGFAEIRVNGALASVATSGHEAVIVSQSERAQARRIDLELREPMTDTDGDGMPDWWEELYGLDPDSAADARGDLDGDGLSNLEEFLSGLPPAEDNRRPRLARSEFIVYPAGRSGLALRVIDTDTAPEQIMITVISVPSEGQLVVRNGSGGRVLAPGDRFTAAEAARGLLEFRRTAFGQPLAARVSAAFRLTDAPPAQGGADPQDAPSADVVRLSFYRDDANALDPTTDWMSLADTTRILPGVSGAAALRRTAALFARHGNAVIWDLLDSRSAERLRSVSGSASEKFYATELAPLYGPERPLLLLGGAGADVLEGGLGADILFGGAGTDVLTGNRGADRFVVDVQSGTDRITDFNPAEGDQIDLTRLILGTSRALEDYVKVVPGPDGLTALKIVTAGHPASAPSVTVELAKFPLSADTLVDLVSAGALLVGDLPVTPLFSVERVADAAENGLVPGRFMVRRAGSVQVPVTVRLAISGSASNGVDYQLLADTLTFPQSVRELGIDIRPYSDALDEATETVRLELLAGTGYRVSGSGSFAELVIRDLQPVLNLELVRREASFSPLAPALLLLHRDGLVDRQIIVRLRWNGSAALSVLEPLPELVELARGETSRLIEIRPRTGISPPDRALGLAVQVLEQGSYLLGSQPEAQLVVTPTTESFDAWVSRLRPPGGGGGDPATVAASDPGGFGLSLLSRFAFGLSPTRPDTNAAVLPRIVTRHGRPGLEFVVQPGARGITVEAELTTDLRSWAGGSAHLREVSGATGAEQSVGWRRYEATGPEAGMACYFRVRLQLQP